MPQPLFAFMNPPSTHALLTDKLSERIRQCLPDARRAACPDPPGASLAALAEAIRRDPAVPAVLAVLPTPVELEAFRTDVQAFCSDAFGFRDYPMLDLAEDDPETAAARLAVLSCLATVRHPRVVVATCVQALLQPSADPVQTDRLSLDVSPGDETGLDFLMEWLLTSGYHREPEVFDIHAFAVKGGIVDVWPTAARRPVRIEFFGDVVESLRAFNVEDQRSVHRMKTVRIPPSRLPKHKQVHLHTFLPDGAVVLWIRHEEGVAEAELFAENGALSEAHRLPAVMDALGRRARLREIFVGDPPPSDTEPAVLPFGVVDGVGAMDMRHADPDLMALRRRECVAACRRCRGESGAAVHVCLDTPGMLEHLAGDFADLSADLRVAPLSGGFSVAGEADRVRAIWLAQADLYGQAKRPRMRSLESVAAGAGDAPDATDGAGALDALAPTLEHIAPGDHVVHLEYGIGRFTGTREMELGGRLCEVLCIAYANNTNVYLPVSQANLISRYTGAGDAPVRLHAIGGSRWSGDKASARRAVEGLALRMLETQARRRQMTGFAFEKDTPYLHEFEASFPYAETPGQLTCIEAVRRDMSSPHPMDRLICGDAGYGKTEVAIRAAFISAMQGRQVAVLVPTTVLAQQHYDTFCDRMAAYPLNIAMHSRFCSRARREAALEGIAKGTVDIIIGTHGLLQPNIRFKNLGLVIIDEEQRFGVRHKEFLKTIRLMVDVLTLSATPIPRTLYLGLMGARDLSLLQTPPQERVATETRIVRRSDASVRQAILAEINRGGQVFYLHNRVMTIDRVHQHLSALLPHVRMGVGHGQMPSSQIERVMHDFSIGRFDVLLCTTIIESGIDIPRANTILVDRADRFGIADLYQLRGRVGRGGVKAYAYFLLPPESVVAGDARERLKALQQHSGLGTGVSLAMRDLGIRGAGNLLGAEQSGHITAVGFTLYCQLLKQAVARLRGEREPPRVDVSVSLPFLSLNPSAAHAPGAACVPYDYLDDDAQRIEFHRRLVDCASVGDVEELESATADRFGRPPPPVRRVFAVAMIRMLAAGRGIRRVEVDDAGRLLLVPENAPAHPAGMEPVQLQGRHADERLAEILERLQPSPAGG